MLEISLFFMQRMTKKGTRVLKKCVDECLKCRSSSIYNLLRNHYERDEQTFNCLNLLKFCVSAASNDQKQKKKILEVFTVTNFNFI